VDRPSSLRQVVRRAARAPTTEVEIRPAQVYDFTRMGQSERSGSLTRWLRISLGVAVLGVRAKRARDTYVEEVAAGSRPIEGVGTAVAAFVGLDLPSGSQTPPRRRSRG
jgi:hypothetical protein